MQVLLLLTAVVLVQRSAADVQADLAQLQQQLQQLQLERALECYSSSASNPHNTAQPMNVCDPVRSGIRKVVINDRQDFKVVGKFKDIEDFFEGCAHDQVVRCDKNDEADRDTPAVFFYVRQMRESAGAMYRKAFAGNFVGYSGVLGKILELANAAPEAAELASLIVELLDNSSEHNIDTMTDMVVSALKDSKKPVSKWAKFKKACRTFWKHYIKKTEYSALLTTSDPEAKENGKAAGDYVSFKCSPGSGGKMTAKWKTEEEGEEELKLHHLILLMHVMA